MPMAVMAFSGQGDSIRPRRLRENLRLAKEVYTYLWTGPAAADSVEVRAAYVRARFTALLATIDPDFPEGTLDPFVDYIAEKLARAVSRPDEPGTARATPAP
jgi:hypothetical protein